MTMHPQDRLTPRLAKVAHWFEPGLGEPGRLLPMEGLRGAAVLLVFFVHFASQLSQAFDVKLPALALALQELGHVGVDLFFVLSGYLIYASLLRRHRPYAGFLLRRVQRIYPAFLVALALELLLAMLSSSRGGLPSGSWDRGLLLLANLALLPGLFDIHAIVVVAWSLSYEMAFYLALPLLIGLLGMRRWPPLRRVALLLAVVVAMQLMEWTHRRMGMFASGMLLVEALALLRARLQGAPWVDAVVLVLAPLGLASALSPLPANLQFGATFAGGFLLGLVALGRQGVVARLLSAAPLRWLGNISYSYYLLHGFMLALFLFALRPLAPQLQAMGEASYWLLLLPAFLATLLGSILLYLLVELPFSILPAARRQAAPQPLRQRPGELAGA